MGGHASKSLHCPRIPPDTYSDVKSTTTTALRTQGLGERNVIGGLVAAVCGHLEGKMSEEI